MPRPSRSVATGHKPVPFLINRGHTPWKCADITAGNQLTVDPRARAIGPREPASGADVFARSVNDTYYRRALFAWPIIDEHEEIYLLSSPPLSAVVAPLRQKSRARARAREGEREREIRSKPVR